MPPPDARDDRFPGDPARVDDTGRDTRAGGRRRASDQDGPGDSRRSRSAGWAAPPQIEVADDPQPLVFGPAQEISNTPPGRAEFDDDDLAVPDSEPPRQLPDVPVRRLVSFALGGLSALITVAMVVGAHLSHPAYALVVFGVQVLFVIVWTITSQPPAPRVVAAIGLIVAAVADAVSILVSPASLAPLAYVVAGGFLVGVLGQLARRSGRVRVTESLGSSLIVVLGVVSYATLIVLSRNALGTQVIDACVIGVGVALLTAHLADLIAPVLRLAPTVPRGGLGVVLGAMLGTAAAGLTGSLLDGLATLPTALAGLMAALIALMVDLSANYAEASRSLAGAPPALWLVRHMQGPLTAFALAAPTAYAASLILARGL